MQRPVRRWVLPAALWALAAAGLGSCGDSTSLEKDGQASARFIGHRSELVGGDRALGDLGDVLMENEKIRVVIQREGFSRGFGVYGGSLIDADLRRPREQGNSLSGVGNDQFAELFPAFFVQAVAVDEVKVLNDGSDGGPAQVEASGVAGDFLELVGVLNRAVTGSNAQFDRPNSDPRIRYSTIYELHPKAQHVVTRFRVQNISDRPLAFPGRDAVFLLNLLGLPLQGFTVPVGDIALFGATSKVFIPGVGFDLRFGLERAYDRGIDFPAFPGFAAEYIAAKADNVSYGVVVDPTPLNYAYSKRDVYGDGRTPITDSSILVPFVASSFVGLFYSNAPAQITPGESFEVVKRFVLGGGDVGSVLDEIHELRGVTTGKLGGRVLDAVTGAAGEGLSAIVYQLHEDGYRRPFTQYDVRQDGLFGGTLEPGMYSVKIVGPGRDNESYDDFEIRAGETTDVLIAAPSPGKIFVRIVDDRGVPLPAKATAIGRYGREDAGKLTPEFLFDLEAGEEFRSSDMVPDDPDDPSTLEFIEAVAFTADGTAELTVRPGEYEVVSSRGPEYDVQRSRVRVRPSQTATVKHSLRRVVDTRGWLALDSHIHSRNSIDSGMSLDERVVAIAAEGVEIPVSTDHNFITDYAPYVARNDLTPWLKPIVGIEMTTLESGHFNGFPMRYDVGAVTKGAFEWARRPPDAIFDDLRELGSLSPEDTVVQVNHPRDDLLGYFGQYNRDPLTAVQQPPGFIDRFISPSGPAFIDAQGNTTFSFDFEALEILNGKLYWEVHHYRVPEELPPGEMPAEIPPTGSILVDADGDVAYPGVVDDWFNLLNLGYRYVAVGTGDSHTGFDEAGQFRTMVYLGVDQPDAVSDGMLVEGLRSRRAVATNGPLVDFFVNDPDFGAMGQTITDSDGSVSLTYRVTSAPWISVGRINVYRNGVIVHSRELDENRDLAADPFEETIDVDLAGADAAGPIDSWFVVEAIGYRSMYPVIRPAELPPLLLTDALASLAGPLGLANDEFGDLRPPEVFPVTAYAITNPVWVTTDDGAFTPPGVVPLAVQNAPENDPKFQEGIYAESTVSRRARQAIQQSRLGRVDVAGRRNVPLFYPLSDNPADVRKVMARLGALGKHGPH